MGYVSIPVPKGYGFLNDLVRKKVQSLAKLIPNKVWFLYSSLDEGVVYKKLLFSSSSIWLS